MRLCTKTRYGVRAMFDIAYHGSGDTAIQAKEIALRQNIPLRYLEQIFQDLKRAGLVESKRGPRGGYQLKASPGDILLGEVVAALQGPIHAAIAADTDTSPETGLCATPVTKELWAELGDHIESWFASISIADLVTRGESANIPRASGSQPMYYI